MISSFFTDVMTNYASMALFVALLIGVPSPCESMIIDHRSTSRRLSLCSDDPTYLTALGIPCAAHKGINCPSMSLLGLTMPEVDELLEKCPEACGECLAKVPNGNNPLKNKPTPLPSTKPTKHPTTEPSAHVFSCDDDVNYISKLGVACIDHSGINCNAMALLGFTDEEMDDLFSKCRKSCGKCPSSNTDRRSFSEKTPTKVKVKRTKNPTSRPTLMCRDNPSYSDGFGSLCSDFSGLDCAMMGLLGYSERDVRRLIKECRESCGYCPDPTKNPSLNPSSSPTLTITSKPSSSPTSLPSAFPTSRWPTEFPTYSPTITLPFVKDIPSMLRVPSAAPQYEELESRPVHAPSGESNSPTSKRQERYETLSPTKPVQETLIISMAPFEITLAPYNKSLTDEELNIFVIESNEITEECVTDLNPLVSVIFFTSVEWQVNTEDNVTLKLKKKAVVKSSDTKWLEGNEKLVNSALHSCLDQESKEEKLILKLQKSLDEGIDSVEVRVEVEARSSNLPEDGDEVQGFGLWKIIGAATSGILVIAAISVYFMKSSKDEGNGKNFQKNPGTTPRKGLGNVNKSISRKQAPLSTKSRSRPTPIQRRSSEGVLGRGIKKGNRVHFPESASISSAQLTAEESSSGEFDEKFVSTKAELPRQSDESKLKFAKGQKVIYGKYKQVGVIVKIDIKKGKVYYTVLLVDGKEKTTTEEHLSLATQDKQKKQTKVTQDLQQKKQKQPQHSKGKNEKVQKKKNEQQQQSQQQEMPTHSKPQQHEDQQQQEQQQKQQRSIQHLQQSRQRSINEKKTATPHRVKKRVTWDEIGTRTQSPAASVQSSLQSGYAVSQDSQDEFEASLATTPASVFSQSSVSVFSEQSTTDDSEVGFFVSSQSLSEDSPDLY